MVLIFQRLVETCCLNMMHHPLAVLTREHEEHEEKKQAVFMAAGRLLKIFSKNIYQSRADLSIKGDEKGKGAKNSGKKGRKVSKLGKTFPLFAILKSRKN